MAVHPHRLFAEAAELRRTHHPPMALLTTADLHHPKYCLQDLIACAELRWLGLKLPRFLEEGHSDSDVL